VKSIGEEVDVHFVWIENTRVFLYLRLMRCKGLQQRGTKEQTPLWQPHILAVG
jgi:hypothetical protein